nr:HNH endonuclease signature motif containing protein [Quisquiliibacterium transsilvanicum]
MTAIDLFAGLGGFSEGARQAGVRVAWARFAAKVEKAGDCLEWTAGLMGGGYGQFHFEGRPHYAHRWLYERTVGPIPDGMTLDHLCRNRRCVNPVHLEVVTRGENVLRGEGPSAKAARTRRCPAGHEYTGANVSIKRDGSRRCLACHRERERKRYTAVRAAA